MINPKTADVERGVIYVPGHANGNLRHKDCESGVITSFNKSTVFIRFDKRPRAKIGCSREDLYWEFDH